MQNNDKKFFTKPSNILLVAIICTALWGSAIPAIKIGCEMFNIVSDDIATKMLFAGVRFLIAGFMVMCFNCIVNKKWILPSKASINGIALLGLVQTMLQYIFFYISVPRLSGVKGSILNSVGNFFAVILAHMFFKKDKINGRKLIGCLLGFAGVVLCNFKAGGLDMNFSILGEGFLLLAAFCFAMGSIITKFVTQKENSVTITGYQLSFGGVLLIIIGLIFGGKLSFTSFTSDLMLLYLAALSAVAFSLWAQLLKYNHVGKISIYSFLNPIFGVILSGIMLGENFINIETASAVLLVCLGIYIVNIRKE